MRSKTCPSIAPDSHDECDSCECPSPVGDDSLEFQSHLEERMASLRGKNGILFFSSASECAIQEAEAGRDANVALSFDDEDTGLNTESESANAQFCVRNTFIEIVPIEPSSPPQIMRSKTCPDVATNSWDEGEDEKELLQESQPHAESQLSQFALRANAKPFFPQDVPSSLRTEMIMQQVLESLNSVCECTPREAVAALDYLRVPFNTPAAAWYGQDNSPCLSEVTNRSAVVCNEDVPNRFAMVCNEDVVYCA